MAIKESALSLITSIAQGDFIRVVTSVGASRRITVANLSDAIKPRIGAWQNVSSLPFTAPSDGFIRLFNNPSDSQISYSIYNINGGQAMSIWSISGLTSYQAYPVRKGDILTLRTSSANSNVTISFSAFE